MWLALYFSLQSFPQNSISIINHLQLIDFSFLSWTVFLVPQLKTDFQSQCHKFFLLLSSRSFIALHFVFQSVIHFEFFFVVSIRSVCNFICLHVQLFWHHLLKGCLCRIVLPLLLYQRSVDSISVDLFLGTLSCSIDLFILPSVPYCLDYCSFLKFLPHHAACGLSVP